MICLLAPERDYTLTVPKLHPHKKEPGLLPMTSRMASLVLHISLIYKLIGGRTDLEYVVPVTVGTPPQTVHLDFDTVSISP